MELLSYKDTVALISPNFENDIYHFSGDSLELKFPFEFHPLRTENYKGEESLEHMDDFLRTTYLESERWIFAIYWSAKYHIRNFIYDKQQKRFRVGKLLLNDIDRIESDGKTTAVENNTFVCWCNNEDPEKNPVLQVLYLK